MALTVEVPSRHGNPRPQSSSFLGLPYRVLNTWTPKVCRIIAFYGYWAIILPHFGGFRYEHQKGTTLRPTGTPEDHG